MGRVWWSCQQEGHLPESGQQWGFKWAWPAQSNQPSPTPSHGGHCHTGDRGRGMGWQSGMLLCCHLESSHPHMPSSLEWDCYEVINCAFYSCSTYEK